MRSSESGFTLLELLIASLIMVTALIGIVGTMSNIAILNQFNRDRTIAALHAEYILEQISYVSFSGLESSINDGDWDLAFADLTAAPYSFTSVLVNEAVDTSVLTSGDPLRISVSISWQDQGQNTRTFTLETSKTN